MSAPSLAQKVSNIKHMPVLLAATSATKDPADGYLVKDIVKMSFESHQTRLFLQQYLLNQLITSNNVFSKIKILRLFLVLLEEGHVEFKQNLRRSPEPFSEAAKLRPHQPKDQKLVAECGRIRDMADKILDILFSEVPEMRKRPTNTQDEISSSTSSSGGGGGTASRITGFGNTSYGNNSSSSGSSPSLKTTTTDKLKSLFGTSGKSPIVYDPSYATMDPVPHNTSSNSPFTAHIPSSSSSTNRYQGSQARPTGAPHARGQAGGGWGQDDGTSGYKPSKSQWSSSNYRERQAAAREEEEEEEEELKEHLSSTGEDLSSYEQTSIEQEQRLVDDITAPGGVRAAPPRESLNAFITRCKVLDALSIVECLRLKLLGEESQTVLRALFVIEALLRSDIPDILSHLDIVLQDLSNLTSSPNSSIQAKSKKILVQLTSVNVQRVPETARSNQQQLSAEEERPPVEDPEEEETDGGQSSGVSSIFSGLSVSGEKTTRSAAVKHKKKKPAVKKQVSPAARRPQHTNGTAAAKEKGAFEDILGLGDLSSAPTTGPTEQAPGAQQPQAVMEEQGLMMYEEPEPQDDSLLTFEEDVEFDPLKRSDSVTRSNAPLTKAGSLSKGLGAPVTLEAKPAAPESSPAHPPLTSQESLGHIKDLTGVDLSAKPAEQFPQQLEVMYPLPPSMAPPTSMNVMITTSAGGMMPHPSYPQGAVAAPGIQLVSMPSGPAGQVGQVGQVPLTLQAGGVGYGGGAPTVVPVMYAAPQGTPGMMYHQPQFGGVARPVQRAADTKEPTPPPETGFSFIGKSNKNNAFAFVQDEMKATRTKK